LPISTGGIIRRFTASSLCVFQRNLDHPKPDGRGINISGVDFWHAVEFSRNGRFLRTHPLGLSSGRFPSVFPTLSAFFRPFDHPPASTQKRIPGVGSEELVCLPG